jgi:hypothetical protein
VEDVRQKLLDALAEVITDHSVASTHGVVTVIRRHVCDETDPELDGALIRAQFLIASRRYLRAPRRMVNAFNPIQAPAEPLVSPVRRVRLHLAPPEL